MTVNYISDCLKMLSQLTVPSYLNRKIGSYFYPIHPKDRIHNEKRIYEIKENLNNFYKSPENVAILFTQFMILVI